MYVTARRVPYFVHRLTEFSVGTGQSGRSVCLEICGEAVDGLDAIEKAEQLNPDLIVLDLAMPQMNGAEAASVLKRKMPRVPIILFTMYAETIGESQASTLGVDLVLSKTDGLIKLADCAQALLAQRNDKTFGAHA